MSLYRIRRESIGMPLLLLLFVVFNAPLLPSKSIFQPQETRLVLSRNKLRNIMFFNRFPISSKPLSLFYARRKRSSTISSSAWTPGARGRGSSGRLFKRGSTSLSLSAALRTGEKLAVVKSRCKVIWCGVSSNDHYQYMPSPHRGLHPGRRLCRTWPCRGEMVEIV